MLQISDKRERVLYVQKIAGRWPRKLESSKECVKTHLPMHVTPKMDSAHSTEHLLFKMFSSMAAGRRCRQLESCVGAYIDTLLIAVGSTWVEMSVVSCVGEQSP